MYKPTLRVGSLMVGYDNPPSKREGIEYIIPTKWYYVVKRMISMKWCYVVKRIPRPKAGDIYKVVL